MLADGGLFDVSDHPLEVTDLISEHSPDVIDLLSEHPLKVTDLLAESANISDHNNLTDLLGVSYTDLLLSSNRYQYSEWTFKIKCQSPKFLIDLKDIENQ
jgi:hypothetical protein